MGDRCAINTNTKGKIKKACTHKAEATTPIYPNNGTIVSRPTVTVIFIIRAKIPNGDTIITHRVTKVIIARKLSTKCKTALPRSPKLPMAKPNNSPIKIMASICPSAIAWTGLLGTMRNNKSVTVGKTGGTAAWGAFSVAATQSPGLATNTAPSPRRLATVEETKK